MVSNYMKANYIPACAPVRLEIILSSPQFNPVGESLKYTHLKNICVVVCLSCVCVVVNIGNWINMYCEESLMWDDFSRKIKIKAN